jgi:glycosyltransferase involved in cell wall biosynthesis
MGLVGSDKTIVERRIRVAHIVTLSTPFGGAQRNTLLTLRGLLRDGYEADLICGPGGLLIKEARAVGARVNVIADLGRPVNFFKDARILFELFRLCQSRKYDIVHTHSTKAGFLGRLAAWLAGVPVIIHTFHGYPFLMSENLKTRGYIALERAIASVTDSVICVGELLRQELCVWRMIPEQKLFTIYSGIDFSSYVPKHSPEKVKQDLGVETAWPLVGSIGHLVEAKAQHHLIETVALLRNKYPRIKLVLVGDGPLRSRLEQRILELGVVPNVSLLGEREDIADLLSIFDIYAMSSRNEGVGRALTEAMYWGLPIATTLVNGIRELIQHEQTGLGVPAGDPKSLASAIDRLISDSDFAKTLGHNAQRKVRGLMDSEKMVTAITALYDRLIVSKIDKCSAVGIQTSVTRNIENHLP